MKRSHARGPATPAALRRLVLCYRPPAWLGYIWFTKPGVLLPGDEGRVPTGKCVPRRFFRLPSGLQTDLLAQSGFLAPARPHAQACQCASPFGVMLACHCLPAERRTAAAKPALSSSYALVPSENCPPMPTAAFGMHRQNQSARGEGGTRRAVSSSDGPFGPITK